MNKQNPLETESMEVKETNDKMKAVFQLREDDKVLNEISGHLAVAVIITESSEETMSSSVMIGPLIKPSELLAATSLLLYSVAKTCRQLNIMDAAEQVIKKALEHNNDLSE